MFVIEVRSGFTIYHGTYTYNVPQPFKILCDCNIALQLMFSPFHSSARLRYVQIEEGLFVVCKELEGAVGVLAAWRECGMFAVNGRPYITPF